MNLENSIHTFQKSSQQAFPQSTPQLGVNVLVVDDEPDSRTLLRIMLSQAGAEVTTVESAQEALAQFQASIPDVLIIDIGMPGEDGYALIRSVRRLEVGAAVPALALTAFASLDDLNRTLRAGFDAHLSKPVEPSNLEEAVAKLVRQSRAPKPA